MAQSISDKLFINKGYVDDIMSPFNTFEDLANTSKTLFNGLVAVVTNNTLPVTFQFAYAGKKINKKYWVIKKLPIFENLSQLNNTVDEILLYLNDNANSNAFYVGLEATIQSGATTGEIEKYIVTEVTDGVPTWELVVSKGTNISTNPSAVAEMLNAHETGNLVYTTGPVYSYESGDPAEVVYTADQAEAAGQAGYTEYPEGLYLVSDDSNGDVALSDVVINNSTDGLSIKVIGDDIRDDIE